MYKRILMAYDGSEAGQHALLECKDLVQWTGAALTLVAVMPHHIDFIGAEGGFYDPQISEREKENYRKILEQGLQGVQRASGAMFHQITTGDPTEVWKLFQPEEEDEETSQPNPSG